MEPVYVLGAHSGTALGIIRGLAQGGIPAVGFYPDKEPSSTIKSRYWQETTPYGSVDELADILIKRRGKRKGILMFSRDEDLLMIDTHGSLLAAQYHIPVIPGTTFSHALHKEHILEIGRSAGFDVPRTSTLSEYRRGMHNLRFPVVVKSVNSTLPGRLYMPVFASDEELLEASDSIPQDREEVVIQEYLPHGEYRQIEVQSYLSRAGPIIAGMHRKVQVTPTRRSKASVVTCILESTWEEALVGPIQRMTQELGFNGPLNTEVFIGSSEMYFVETNFRFSMNTPLDNISGINLPLFVYHDLNNEDTSRFLRAPTRGVKMTYEHAAGLYFLMHARGQRMSLLGNILNSKAFVYFDPHDLRPFVGMIGERVKKLPGYLFPGTATSL